jgi:hypothetical protein
MNPHMGPSLVVVEDIHHKMDECVKSPDYQLAGEMVAAAIRNFNMNKLPQTIFALRVIGMFISMLLLFVILIFHMT